MKTLVLSLDQERELKEFEYRIRKDLIKLCAKKTIHIGGCLSVTDIITVLWQKFINYNFGNPSMESRDRFFLSKGHCQAAVAFNMALKGAFSEEEVINEYGCENSRWSMAPCKHTNLYYESSATGSLGMGLPLATGVAKAIRCKGNMTSKVYVVIGDGELQEGSNWEAAMFAGNNELSNLVLIIDNNEIQFDGRTNEIMDIGDINRKFSDFGWKCLDIDGHNNMELYNAFVQSNQSKKPFMINAHTIKGKGVPYMEHNHIWHAGRIKESDLTNTLELLKNSYPEISYV